MTTSESSREQVPIPRVANEQNAVLYSMLQQLNESQWCSPEQLAEGQLQQLKKLLGYSILYSPYYRQRLHHVDINCLDLENFKQLPVLTRIELQENNDTIDCSRLPDGHGEPVATMTSGSTATPVRLRGSALTATIWNAINMREQLWHRRDPGKTTAAIRWRSDAVGMPPQGVTFQDWGMPINQFFETGPAYFLNSAADISDQLQWLRQVNPHYLMSHPSNLKALLRESQKMGVEFANLVEFRTVGESVDDELRELVRDEFNAPLVDLYSSQEVGFVALQCPHHDHYHIQSESLYVEVVREDGSACEPGESGKLLVSSLRNYATPLIRYEIGDHAELGEPCDCGRGLPVLNRINGRVRNMLQLPDGNGRWPNFGFQKMMQIAPLQQFQVVQQSLQLIELKLVVEQQLGSEQESAIKQILGSHLGHPFEINISYHTALPRSASGKFEDFVCMIETG